MPGLGAGGNGDARPAAADGGHLDAAAERRRGHGQGYAAVDVGAVALKKAVRRHRNENVEVAGRGATQSGLAFVAKPDPGAVLDAAGYGDGKGLFLLHPARAAARLARVADDLPGTLARGTRALYREEA